MNVDAKGMVVQVFAPYAKMNIDELHVRSSERIPLIELSNADNRINKFSAYTSLKDPGDVVCLSASKIILLPSEIRGMLRVRAPGLKVEGPTRVGGKVDLRRVGKVEGRENITFLPRD